MKVVLEMELLLTDILLLKQIVLELIGLQLQYLQALIIHVQF